MLPLKQDGIISYLIIRKPMLFEITDCVHVQMTSTLPWDPYSLQFLVEESKSLHAQHHPHSSAISSVETDILAIDIDESEMVLGDIFRWITSLATLIGKMLSAKK